MAQTIEQLIKELDNKLPPILFNFCIDVTNEWQQDILYWTTSGINKFVNNCESNKSLIKSRYRMK